MSTVPGKAQAPKLPPQVESARDLLLDELGKLLTIEETLAKRVLPTLVRELQDSELKQAVPALRANVNCAAAMGTEHYEVNAYEAAIRLADAIGTEEVGGLLRATLEEEIGALEKLGTQADRLQKLAVEERAAA